MRGCWMYVAGVLGLALPLSALHRLALLQEMSLHLAYGLGYATVAGLLLMSLRRCRPAMPSALQRMVSLLVGAGLALIDVSLAGYAADAGQQLFFSALLGAALVQVLARVLTRQS